MDDSIKRVMQDAYFGDIDNLKRNHTHFDFNVTDKGGHTPLLWAIEAEQETAVELLLQQGALVDFSNPKTGETPLMLAVKKENEIITRLLLRHNANLDACNNGGQTIWDMAPASMRPQLERAVARRKRQTMQKMIKLSCIGALLFASRLVVRSVKQQEPIFARAFNRVRLF